MNKLPPFKFFALQNFPFIEEDFDTLKNYELMCKIVEYIKKNIIPVVDEHTEQIDNLLNWFDNLDVQEEIDNKLDEMVEDGTIEEILSELLVYNKLGVQDNQQMVSLSMQRVMRTLERNANHPDHVSGEDYASLQGGCYTGNNKMVIARIRNNNINDTLLQEISLDSGLVIRETTLQLAHANSITYDPINNKLYVASLVLDSTQLHQLYVIDYVNFTLENTITFDTLRNTEGVHSVSYDVVTNKLYVATEDTNLNNAITLYEMNLESYLLNEIELVDYTGLLSTTNNNDILVYNNIFYLLKYNPQVIISYDLDNKNLRNIYNIDTNTKDGYTIGEMQNLSIKYDTVLKNFVIVSNHVETQSGWYQNFQYFETNPVYNISANIDNNASGHPTSKTLIVDINSTSKNPNGESSRPFKHVAEAIEYVQKLNGYAKIEIKAGEYPPFTVAGNNCFIEITKHDSADVTDVIIDGMRFDKVANYIYMYKVCIAKVENENSNYYSDYDLVIDFCNHVRLADINFTNEDTTYHIYIRRSTLEFINLYYANTLFYTMTNPILICLDNTPTYNYYDNSRPSINRAIKVVSSTNISDTEVEVDIEKFKDCMFAGGTWCIKYHGDYTYKDVYLPVNTSSSGNRLTSVEVCGKLIVLDITNDLENNKIKFKIDKAIDLYSLTPADVTSTTTGDIEMYYIPNPV